MIELLKPKPRQRFIKAMNELSAIHSRAGVGYIEIPDGLYTELHESADALLLDMSELENELFKAETEIASLERKLSKRGDISFKS